MDHNSVRNLADKFVLDGELIDLPISGVCLRRIIMENILLILFLHCRARYAKQISYDNGPVTWPDRPYVPEMLLVNVPVRHTFSAGLMI